MTRILCYINVRILILHISTVPLSDLRLVVFLAQ